MDKWPHSPSHKFDHAGTYMITAGTMKKEHFIKTPQDFELIQETLFNLAEKYQWRLEAWSIFSNHYHFICHKQENPKSLKTFITHLHASTARALNKSHNSEGRKVWFQYWDSHLTFEESYLARLSYVMRNPVKHKIVTDPREYPWCSSRWFAENAMKSHQITVARFKIDQLEIYDDFDD